MDHPSALRHLPAPRRPGGRVRDLRYPQFGDAGPFGSTAITVFVSRTSKDAATFAPGVINGSDWFRVVSTDCNVVAPGSTCTVKVTFVPLGAFEDAKGQPTEKGRAVLTISSRDGQRRDVALSGAYVPG